MSRFTFSFCKVWIIIIILLQVCFSCKNKNKCREVFYNDTKGNLIKKVECINSGETTIKHFRNGNIILTCKLNYKGDTVSFKKIINKNFTYFRDYNNNNKIASEGLYYLNKKNGWWTYYDRNGNIKCKKEFYNVDDINYVNQEIYYNEKGQINMDKSIYLKLDIEDTLHLGKNIGRIAIYPSNSKKSDLFVMTSEELSPNFSNINQTKLDTFYSENNSNIWFGINFTRIGYSNIRGLIEEVSYQTNLDTSKVEINKRFFFLNKKVYIIDTIN